VIRLPGCPIALSYASYGPHRPAPQDYGETMSVTPLSEPCPDSIWPAFLTIAQDKRPTVTRLPRGCVMEVSRIYCLLMNKYNKHPSWESLHALWAFPKAVFAAGPRGGRAHWSSVGQSIKSRAIAYLTRPVADSWEDSKTLAQRNATGNRPWTRAFAAGAEDRDDERWVKRITKLTSHGALSKACGQLTSAGVQDARDPEVLTTLKSLHPNEPAPGVGPMGARSSLVFDLSENGSKDRLVALRKTIRSFPPDSAPGPSGLRPDHLKDMVGNGAETDSAGLLAAIDLFVRNLLIHGLPPLASPVMCAARLTPLAKDNGVGVKVGTRPIAAGECLRRLVGKVLMSQADVVHSLRKLAPQQCGVGVQGAYSLLSMGLQQYINLRHSKGESDWAVLQLDFKNAFNTIQRSKLLDSTRKYCSQAVAWMETCYSFPSPLFCGDNEVLSSASGVQQGDPCGPAGFCWGIQDIVQDIEGSSMAGLVHG